MELQVIVNISAVKCVKRCVAKYYIFFQPALRWEPGASNLLFTISKAEQEYRVQLSAVLLPVSRTLAHNPIDLHQALSVNYYSLEEWLGVTGCTKQDPELSEPAKMTLLFFLFCRLLYSSESPK